MLEPFKNAATGRRPASPARSQGSKPHQLTTSLSLARASDHRSKASEPGKASAICAVGKIGSFPTPDCSKIAQEKQARAATPPQMPQCAPSTPTPAPYLGTLDHKNTKTTSISTLQGSHSAKVVVGVPVLPTAARKSSHQKRRPRRRTACVDNFIQKRWRDTSEIEKFSVAAAHTEAVGGFAFSLNLGPKRESMLLSSDAPRTRMRKNLDKHLRAAGLEDLPLAWLFEVTPDKDGNRLHLHGVVDTSGLSDADISRLEAALIKAAGVATHAVGGERQLDMKPVYYAAGWVDYLLKNTRHTAATLRVDQDKLFSLNHTMTRRAQDTYDAARSAAKRKAA